MTPGARNFSIRPGITFGPYVFTLLDSSAAAVDLSGYLVWWQVKDKPGGTLSPQLPDLFPSILATTVGTFTANASTDFLTRTAHGLVQGTRVRFTTTTTLPGGLALATDYYVIDDPEFPLTANTWQVSTSPNGTKVDITSTGTGTHTVSRTAGQILVPKVTDNTSHDWTDYSGSHDMILEDPEGNRLGPFIAGSFTIASGISNPAE